MQTRNVLALTPSPDPNKPPIPQYDLSGERVCIALFIQRDNKKLDFFCHMKPPAAERVIRLYQDRNTYRVPSNEKDGGTEVVLYGSTDVDRAFFNEHKIAVTYGGQELTPEQLDKVDRVNSIRANAVALGLLTVGNPKAVESDEDDEAPTLEEFLDESPSVRQFVQLTDDAGVEHQVEIVHHFESPTMEQTTKFKRSLKMKTIPGGAQKVTLNHKELGKLYDAAIQRVDGVIGDRSAIIEKLPFVWKLNAIQMLFQDAQIKNG